MKKIFYLLFISLIIIRCDKQLNNEVIVDISDLEWYIWLDKDAEWINDSLYLPPVNVKNLPKNKPTCGWDELYEKQELKTNLPATVEEYFWNKSNNQYGISGNYKGVSWFFTSLYIPESSKRKRVSLCFESIRMRAEVYVNNKLTGYDLIDGTPFEVDISEYLEYGSKNKIAVRITDPNGNFNWRDSRQFKWGNYTTISSHGFGGITGKVFLHITDSIYINDIYIKNKPEITHVDVEVMINNISDNKEEGQIIYELFEVANPEKIVFNGSKKVNISNGENILSFSIKLKDVKIWSPESPNLYNLKVKWLSENSYHEVNKNFGFRWFDVIKKNGERYFKLNNKRIVLRSSISWSFWPVNGIYPTKELAAKQVSAAKKLGLNMLNFHRAIGCNVIFNEAAKQGLLYYEEPGGYRTGIDDFSRQWAREKLLRMIKRDRSHPSLIIYNMQNELGRDPSNFDKETIKKAHELDETRFITYTSTNFSKGFYDNVCPEDTAQIKMHMLPYNHDIQYYGYWDQHHAGGTGCYADDMYKSPEDYRRFTSNKAEIVFYGEEGAIGTPPQLPEIVNTISNENKPGWDGKHYINTYLAYDSFLKQKGFYNYFSDMKTLITSMGNVALYYQGRVIENIRINNLVDGYVVNGWESEKIENHSGIVDINRNIKGNPEILAYYNQPSYIAIKARNKVIELGDKSLVDFYIINETNIHGECELQIECTDSSGTILKKTFPVNINGGNEYGQLLFSQFEVKPSAVGYCHIKANLIQNGTLLINGKEEIFSVSINSLEDIEKIAYNDDSSLAVFKMLSAIGIKNKTLYPEGKNISELDVKADFAKYIPKERVLVVGFEPPERMSRNQDAIFDWIMDGNTLIIIKNAEKWAEYLNQKEVMDYRGFVAIGKNWYGGNHFVKEHPLFKDLPVNCAFNWEYQCLALYTRKRMGLRLNGEECVVGVQCDHRPELFTAVGIIPVGRGKIIISTLDLEKAIKSGEKSSVVAKKILTNYIEYALKF